MGRREVTDSNNIRSVARIARDRLEDQLFRRQIISPALYVCEFPKSGGTWVQSMLMDIMRAGHCPPSRLCPVTHNHWANDGRWRPAVYVVRDGRDVVVSMYFHNARLLRARTIWAPRLHAFFTSVLGHGFDLDDIRGNMPLFIEGLAVDPFGGVQRRARRSTVLGWPDHVRGWVSASEVPVARYESLLADCPAVLAELCAALRISIDLNTAQSVADRHSFAAKTGRSRGVEDRGSFYRKGIAGDWRNWFTQEAAQVFDAYGGDALIELGYERDRAWVQTLAGKLRSA